ncbi:MAG: hypothetical protein AB1349_07910 [Elusimicrobiota bacterium]
MNNKIPPVKKLRMMLLQNHQTENISLFGNSDEEIKRSNRYQKLIFDGWNVVSVYDVRGSSDLVNIY